MSLGAGEAPACDATHGGSSEPSRLPSHRTPATSPSRVIAADWSGRVRGERPHLWLAEWSLDDDRLASLAPASRAEATERLVAAADADPALVVGLDFSFSLPASWLRAWRIDTAFELWHDVGRLEGWLVACPPPFWGRPGRRRPDGLTLADHYRQTELACRPRPRSTLQLSGAGAVGTASLRGMPVLDRLRQAGFAIWPFDAWRLPAAVEVWPRLALGRLVKSDRASRAAWLAAAPGAGFDVAASLARPAVESADAFDAVVAAAALAGRARVPRPTAVDPAVQLEGWIDGVPAPEDPPSFAPVP